METLAATKLAPQDRDERHVVRHRLLGLLDEVLCHRLTLVHAGAGYGKTSLLSQWLKEARQRRIAAAWLTLEEDETDPSTCLGHIITALTRLGYIEHEAFSNPGHFDERMPVASLATAFINVIAEKEEPLVVFLDEYNRACSEATDALLRTLVRRSPRHVHFVIASRWPPEVDMERLRASGDLIEISARDLRFSSHELGELLEASGVHLGEAELHRLTDRTEGWPIAIQMARLWLNGDGTRARFVSEFSGRTTDLARYLTEQVLSELPEDQQNFVMQTAILERVNGDIVNAVTGRRDGWSMLEEICERNLFLVPEGDERQWFRYHTLFLEFLRDRLQKDQGCVIADLHHRAAEWLATHGMLKAAVHHALQSGDHDLAADLLSGAGGWRLIMDGRIQLIRGGIDALPDAVIRARLPLALAKAFLLVKDGDILGARQYFAGLEGQARRTDAPQDRADWRVLEHIIADYADDPVSMEDVERLQSLRREIPKFDHVVLAVLSDSLATKYFEFGQFQKSLDACADAISHYRVLGSLYGEVFLRFTQAKAHLAQGRLDEAEAVLRQTDRDLEVRFGDGVDLSAHVAIYLAEVLSERRLIAEASARLEHALPEAEQSDGWFELYGAGYTAAAAVGWATGGLPAALAVLNRARAIAASRPLDRLGLLADCESVYYLCLSERLEDARQYVSRLQTALTSSAAGPQHWLIATVAARLALIFLLDRKYAEVGALLAPHTQAAELNGDIRQLVAFRLLLADSRASLGDNEGAAELLDRAVHDGMFSGFKRPYVDYGRRLLPVVDLILRRGTKLPPDRYRDSFLRELRHDIRSELRRQTGGGLLLTPGERGVLLELDRGLSNKEIAKRLRISPNTVKYRVKALFQKLGVSVRSDAVRVARERALLAAREPE